MPLANALGRHGVGRAEGNEVDRAVLAQVRQIAAVGDRSSLGVERGGHAEEHR